MHLFSISIIESCLILHFEGQIFIFHLIYQQRNLKIKNNILFTFWVL